MSIINRDLSRSEQKEWDQWTNAGGPSLLLQVSTGATQWMFGPMPYPFTVQSARSAAVGVSGGLQIAFGLQRFIPGAGGTLINMGVSNMVLNNMGTSGVLAYSGLAIPGSTLLNGLPGDVIMFTASGSNAAVQSLILQMVWFKTQDIVQHNAQTA